MTASFPREDFGWHYLDRAGSRDQPALVGASMPYDAANSNVVLFGGFGRKLLHATWTWGTSLHLS